MKVIYLTITSVLFLFLPSGLAVKTNDFKTCSQSGFCRRGRALATRAKENSATWTSPYSIDASTISISPNQASFTADVKSSLYPNIKFGLDVHILDDGVIRVRMDEINGIRKRYDEAAHWSLVSEPHINQDIHWSVDEHTVKAVYGDHKDIQVDIEVNPIRIVLRRDGREQVIVNNRGLLHMEHFREKNTGEDGSDTQEVLDVSPTAWFEGAEEDAYWEEKFGSWTDSKPKGMCFLVF